MRLILVRHGETFANVNNLIQGQRPGKLTENGINQAKKLGLRFKDTKIDTIYSSDLQRAIDTASYVMKYHPELKLNMDKRIRERMMGRHNGESTEDIDWNNPPEDMESHEEMLVRGGQFLDYLFSKHDDTVMVVCHGGIKKRMLILLQEMTKGNFEVVPIPNTAVSIFDIEKEGNNKVLAVNDVEHLE